MNDELRDALNKTVNERFLEVREYFLDSLKLSGMPERDLYTQPKPGDAREPTEEELVRRWAAQVAVPVNDICIGIQRAFQTAAAEGGVVRSFRFCIAHIVARVREKREARAGSF